MTLEQYKNLVDYSSMNPKERLDFCRGVCQDCSKNPNESHHANPSKQDADKTHVPHLQPQVESVW